MFTTRHGSQLLLRKLTRKLVSARKTKRNRFTRVFPGQNLTPKQITEILRIHEHNVPLNSRAITLIESTQLASNEPMEDRLAKARLRDRSVLAGVFDGHAGCECAQAVSERLFDYIALCLASRDAGHLSRLAQELDADPRFHPGERFQHYRSRDVTSASKRYHKALQNLVTDLSESDDFTEADRSSPDAYQEAFKTAFTTLDRNMTDEALHDLDANNAPTHSLDCVLSGSCACVVHVEGRSVTTANVGDCRAIIGQYDDGGWNAIRLSNEHTFLNDGECDRLFSSHPHSERGSILRADRLLGALIPLRAFGDLRFKWPKSDIQKVEKAIHARSGVRSNLVLQGYLTPPYLSVEPEVTTHELSLKDQFIVIGTDGLWDLLSDDEVVRLVGEHTLGRNAQLDFVVSPGSTLSAINEHLIKRKHSQLSQDIDPVAATHLLRSAVGRSEKGDVSDGYLSAQLALAPEDWRQHRDDITIVVIHLSGGGLSI